MGDRDQRQLEVGGQRESCKGGRESKCHPECSDCALFLELQLRDLAYP